MRAISATREIFETSSAMQDAVRAHPELRLVGRPTFLFSFTSDEFDVYHVNDFMRTRGWRFNGQQYPNALHMAVTRPQTQPQVVEEFAADLADAVGYAKVARGGGAQVGGDLRRRGRRHDRGGRRVHPGGHGRHARRAVHHPGEVTEPETGRPTAWVRGCVAAQAALHDTLTDLPDDVARRPSRLSGWSVGHLLTHIAATRQRGVAPGWRRPGRAPRPVPRRPRTAAGRDRGGSRPPASRAGGRRGPVLHRGGRGDRRPASRGVGRSLPDLAGVVESSARDVVLSRWREVVVHHGDLGLGPVPLPAGLVAAWLPRELPRLAERTDPGDLLAWVIGRGDPPSLAAW